MVFKPNFYFIATEKETTWMTQKNENYTAHSSL